MNAKRFCSAQAWFFLLLSSNFTFASSLGFPSTTFKDFTTRAATGENELLGDSKKELLSPLAQPDSGTSRRLILAGENDVQGSVINSIADAGNDSDESDSTSSTSLVVQGIGINDSTSSTSLVVQGIGINVPEPLTQNDCSISSDAPLCKLPCCRNQSFTDCLFTGCQNLRELFLHGSGLTGTLPADLQTLSKLQTLDLSDNKFTGSVEALGKLTKLEFLRVSDNKFTGSVEALGKLTDLTTLDLMVNKFTGTVEAFESLTKLTKLTGSDNKFTGSVEALGKLTDLTTLRISDNSFTGSVQALGQLAKLKFLEIQNNTFDGTLRPLGKLQKLQHVTLSSSGSFKMEDSSSDVPKILFDLAPDDLYDLGLSCKWPQVDGLPILARYTGRDMLDKLAGSSYRPFEDYFPLNGTDSKNYTTNFICPDQSFSVLSNGNLEPVFVNKFRTCAEASYSVIPTEAECQKAVTMLSSPTTIVTARREPGLSYCSAYDKSYLFDTSRQTEKQTDLGCNSLFESRQCLCKQASKNVRITCVYRDGQAQLEPSMETLQKFKCLGYGACRTNDATALMLRKESGADVRACASLQDGDHCVDYKCGKYKSHIRNPTRNRIRCKFQVWDGPEKDYCVFCPEGEHKVNATTCRKCAEGKYLKSGPDNDNVACKDCSVGKYRRANQIECTDCEIGRFQNEAGQSKCIACSTGWYQTDEGQSQCTECTIGHKCSNVNRNPQPCPAGEFQNETGQGECEECSEGQYQVGLAKSQCTECPIGHKCTQKDKLPQDCLAGKFQDDTGQSVCKDCSEGQHSPYRGDSECDQCQAGRYQPNKGQSECVKCDEGRYQPDAGQTLCIVCDWYSFCVATGIDEPPLSPYVFIVPVLLLLSIPFIAKVVQLVIKAVTAWKPQSKADAARAKQFVLPKTSDDMVPSVSAFKVREKHFVATGWTEDDINVIKEHRTRVVSYLGSRVQEAGEREQIRIMRCCMNMDVLHDFKTLYDATMQNIRNKEPSGFKAYTTTARKMQAATTKCPRNPSALFDLYDSGRAVYDRFHAFVARAAKASHGAYVYTSHERLPSMKGIYRVLEKGVFKYNHDWTQDLDLGQVRDLVRGGIIDTTMEGLKTVAEYIHTSSDVTVCRVKDRFNEPSGAGWTDLMINFYLNDDPGKHVCEVQLMHFKMYSQRTTQEGHGAYNIFRAASELLSKVYLRSEYMKTKGPRHRGESFDEVSPNAAAKRLMKMRTDDLAINTDIRTRVTETRVAPFPLQ